ncbi:MAG: hypothetical protein HQ596_01820 [Candidatus Saganbacteria bacterium]|nr:hypothetical protein [Candidatus Saganbacteria bacterium]
MLKLKLISFNIDEAKRQELPLASALLHDLEQDGIVELARQAGVPIVKRTLEGNPEILRTALAQIAPGEIPSDGPAKLLYLWKLIQAARNLERTLQTEHTIRMEPQPGSSLWIKILSTNPDNFRIKILGVISENRIIERESLPAREDGPQQSLLRTARSPLTRKATSHHYLVATVTADHLLLSASTTGDFEQQVLDPFVPFSAKLTDPRTIEKVQHVPADQDALGRDEVVVSISVTHEVKNAPLGAIIDKLIEMIRHA